MILEDDALNIKQVTLDKDTYKVCVGPMEHDELQTYFTLDNQVIITSG